MSQLHLTIIESLGLVRLHCADPVHVGHLR